MNPLYYVTFTTSTILASFILFAGFNTADIVNTLSLLCGFLVIFTGVYLLNTARHDPEGIINGPRKSQDGVPVDGITGMQTRRSMQLHRSIDGHYRSSSGSFSVQQGEHGRLMHDYNEESRYGLENLAEDSEDEEAGKRTSFDSSPQANGTKDPGREPKRPPKTQMFR